MSDKCRKAKGELVLCANAKIAESAGFVEVQTMRNHETNQRRELLPCPYCGGGIGEKTP